MTRRKHDSSYDQTEDAIRRAGSIGALERLAGIGRTHDERTAFWAPFCKLPGASGLDAGGAELKRIIRVQAPQRPRPRHTGDRRHA